MGGFRSKALENGIADESRFAPAGVGVGRRDLPGSQVEVRQRSAGAGPFGIDGSIFGGLARPPTRRTEDGGGSRRSCSAASQTNRGKRCQERREDTCTGWPKPTPPSRTIGWTGRKETKKKSENERERTLKGIPMPPTCHRGGLPQLGIMAHLSDGRQSTRTPDHRAPSLLYRQAHKNRRSATAGAATMDWRSREQASAGTSPSPRPATKPRLETAKSL